MSGFGLFGFGGVFSLDLFGYPHKTTLWTFPWERMLWFKQYYTWTDAFGWCSVALWAGEKEEGLNSLGTTLCFFFYAECKSLRN